MNSIELKPLRAKDLEPLEQHYPSEDEAKYRNRLVEQQVGGIVCLIAWIEEVPVGRGFIRWSPDEPVRSALPGVPLLGDLGVREDLQSRGIGSRIMEEIESLARASGYESLALSVDVSNKDARRLYERRGYLESDIPHTPSSWSWIDREGQLRTEQGLLVYMHRSLR